MFTVGEEGCLVLLCVCLNPAVDVTYRLGATLVPGRSHRVSEVHQRAGGKGINVARVARQLGQPVHVLAPVGGATGEIVRADLAAAELPATLIDVAQPTRRTLTVVDSTDATVFNEAGPVIAAAEWSALLAKFEALLAQAELVVLAGSLPPGIAVDSYVVLAKLAGTQGIRVLVDAEGELLRLALEAKPYLVKPNLAELGTVAGGTLDGTTEIAAGAMVLRDLGARNVVVSCGAAGLLAITEEGCWRAVSPEVVAGNPTGAGDALVAALAVGAIRQAPWPDRLRDGVARSAAAVASAVAGEIDLPTCARLAPQIVVERLALAEHVSRIERLTEMER
jgi:tagatose 6-phosphate kinase